MKKPALLSTDDGTLVAARRRRKVLAVIQME